MYIRLPIKKEQDVLKLNCLRLEAENLANLVDKIQVITKTKLKHYTLNGTHFICDQAAPIKDKILEIEPERRNNENKKINSLKEVNS